MKPGTKPRNQEIKKRLGLNKSRNMVRVTNSISEVGDIPVPKFALKGVALAEWGNLWLNCPYLDPHKDHEVTLRYCKLLGELHRLKEIVEDEGEVSRGYNDQPRPHPLYARIGVIEREIRALEDRLALNPVERHRVSFEEVRKSGALDELIARNNARQESFNRSRQQNSEI